MIKYITENQKNFKILFNNQLVKTKLSIIRIVLSANLTEFVSWDVSFQEKDPKQCQNYMDKEHRFNQSTNKSLNT